MLMRMHWSEKPRLAAFAPRTPMLEDCTSTCPGMTTARTLNTPTVVPDDTYAVTSPAPSVVPLGETVVPSGLPSPIEKLTGTPGAGLLVESTTLNVTCACSLKPEPLVPMMVHAVPPQMVDS